MATSNIGFRKQISDVTCSLPNKAQVTNLTKQLSLPENIKNNTLVTFQEFIPVQEGSRNSEVQVGHILKLLDVCSCLSAEKHAKKPCVTVTMDDLIFEKSIKPGDIVHFSAKVSRAFTTSMEVATIVLAESPETGLKCRIANAYFTYVSRKDESVNTPLVPIYPNSPTELQDFLLAAERRRSRLTRHVSIQELKQTPLISVKASNSNTSSNNSNKCQPPTYSETVKLVLPVHANHHGTTFGGQLMEWMTNIASMSSLRYSHNTPIVLAVDMITFKAPSHVGDRIVIKSAVNNVFNKSMEVGVKVLAYKVGGPDRHISSAFFYIGSRGKDENLIVLPKLVPGTETEKRRAAEAYGRYHLRLDRRAFMNTKKSPILNPSLKEQFVPIIYSNISSLMHLYSINGWENIESKTRNLCEISQFEDNNMFAFKCEGIINGIELSEGFNLLQKALLKDRDKWDKLCISSKIVQSLTEDDHICQLIMKPLDHRERARDFVLLVSKRTPVSATPMDPYAFAFRSIELDSVPTDPNYERAQVISSGYACINCDQNDENMNKAFKIVYLHQISNSVLPFVATDLMGLSNVIELVFTGLHKYLKECIEQGQT